MTKPPTQVAGVIGIEAAPVTMHEAPPIDWGRVVALPTFQMWAAERMVRRTIHPLNANSLHHAEDVVREMGARQSTFDEYAAWHATKGYWPNETPMGEVKEP